VRTVALVPGSFDPFHLGHAEMVRRALALYDEVVVAVATNDAKVTGLLADAERVAVIEEVFADEERVRVQRTAGLTVDLARAVGATCIVRGLRDSGDVASELAMARTNRLLGGIETVLLPSGPETVHIASRLVREVARGGGDLSHLVPPAVARRLSSRPTPAGQPSSPPAVPRAGGAGGLGRDRVGADPTGSSSTRERAQ
jgi:pantetheine-phosphate adenylyltransferase